MEYQWPRTTGQPGQPTGKLSYPATFSPWPRDTCLNLHSGPCYAIDCTGCAYDPQQMVPAFLAGIYYLINLGP